MTKFFVLIALFAAPFAQAQSQVDRLATFVCKNTAKQGLAAGVYTVRLKETSKLLSGSNTPYDYTGRAEITVKVKGSLAGQPTIVRKGVISFYSEDVNYRAISRDLGLSMYVYLDEMDQAGITIYANSKKIDLSLDCKYERAPW